MLCERTVRVHQAFQRPIASRSRLRGVKLKSIYGCRRPKTCDAFYYQSLLLWVWLQIKFQLMLPTHVDRLLLILKDINLDFRISTDRAQSTLSRFFGIRKTSESNFPELRVRSKNHNLPKNAIIIIRVGIPFFPNNLTITTNFDYDQGTNMPSRKSKSDRRWSMYQNLHDDVSHLLEESDLHFDFHGHDHTETCVKRYGTTIMGLFICRNRACGSNGWSSKRIAINIRMYPGAQYNVRVYNQRC